MSDDAVRTTLSTMRREQDPRLRQYICALHQPDGWSLQQIGDAMGTSREWVRLLELKGLKEIEEGGRRDLSDLPTYTRRKKKHRTAIAVALPQPTIDLLRTLNSAARDYRKGQDQTNVLAFNTMVKNLIDAGVPMNAIARACGQSERTFRRRLSRWGVVSPASPGPRGKPKPKVHAPTCTDPTCPIPGAHVHE